MSNEVWFKVDQTGWAAYPVNAKGWLLVGGYFLALILFGLLILGVAITTPVGVPIFIIGSIIMTVALVIVAMSKTDGVWAWQRDKGNGNDN